jgi:hypothetical protein
LVNAQLLLRLMLSQKFKRSSLNLPLQVVVVDMGLMLLQLLPSTQPQSIRLIFQVKAQLVLLQAVLVDSRFSLQASSLRRFHPPKVAAKTFRKSFLNNYQSRYAAQIN